MNTSAVVETDSDVALLARIRAGDAVALATVYRRHGRRCFALPAFTRLRAMSRLTPRRRRFCGSQRVSKKTIIKHEFSGHLGGAIPPPPPVPPPTPLPPLPGLSATTGAGNAQITREKKTQQPYEGLFVDVDRTVETIAVGSIGNSKAIESVDERYYSPELKTNVYVRRSDPRNGESVYRMVDVKRTEPDAPLFRAPGGYTMTEGKK